MGIFRSWINKVVFVLVADQVLEYVPGSNILIRSWKQNLLQYDIFRVKMGIS